jgi:hypothetical protein
VARSRKAKQWTGALAVPIDDDIGTLMPNRYPVGSPECEQWIDRRADRLHQLRTAKIPELGRQVGMRVDKFDLTTPDGLIAFYTDLVLRLALKLEIPGFMQLKPKWPRQVVYWALLDGDARKVRGERDPDLASCLSLVRRWERGLLRKGKKAAAIRRAKTLRNEVSKLRRKIKARMELTVDNFSKW